MSTVIENTDETNIKKYISYDGCEYSISQRLLKNIGFIKGIIESGLVDDLALPLPSEPVIQKIGHRLLEYMSTNHASGLDFLQSVILDGLTADQYISRIKTAQLNTLEIRNIIEQVFALLSVADYWDFQEIAKKSTEFIALCLSAANQQTVRDWFSGII
jgi:hypothetical protein